MRALAAVPLLLTLSWNMHAEKPPAKGSSKTTAAGSGPAVVGLPDLVLIAMNPSSGFPTSFVVRNSGKGAATLASVLRVEAKFVGGKSVSYGGPISELPLREGEKEICRNLSETLTYDENPLGVGEFQTFKKPLSAPRRAQLKKPPPTPGGNPFANIPPGTPLNPSPHLVCDFDFVVTLDATAKVGEGLGEGNNVTTRRVSRSVRPE